jgi:hypothetical protein
LDPRIIRLRYEVPDYSIAPTSSLCSRCSQVFEKERRALLKKVRQDRHRLIEVHALELTSM